MNKNNSVYILSIQAKDLYIATHLIEKYGQSNAKGLNTKEKDGKSNIHRYIASLDFSLDQIKLKEICQKQKLRFSYFKRKNKKSKVKEYTDTVISVDFDLTVKEYNKFGKNLYIKYGYKLKDYTSTKEYFTDSVWVIENEDGKKELIGIKLNTPLEQAMGKELLGDYFISTYDEKKKAHVYNLSNTEIKTVKYGRDIRTEYYKNGFICNGKHYVRYKRSAGSARIGKCLSIQDKLLKPMQKWDFCGLKIEDNMKIDLPAFEAAISLSGSSLIDTIMIKKENILVIPDYKSVFTDKVISVNQIGDTLVANNKAKNIEIENVIFDGQSLIDISLMGEYFDKGMLLLRNRFFKTCAFNSNIQKFFTDNNITSVEQLNGFTLAEKIEDIKLITTPSSIKYVKFDTLEKWFNNIDEIFGIVKYEKSTKHFNGKMVQTSYQLLNATQFSYEKLEEFLQPTVNYMKCLRDNPDALRNHIKYEELESKTKNESDKVLNIDIKSKNDLIYEMLSRKTDFHKTEIYDKFKREIIKSFYEGVYKHGRVLVEGNYSTVCSNPFEMLCHSIKDKAHEGKSVFEGTYKGKSIIGIGNVYSRNFEFNKRFLAARSPFITVGNAWLVYNKYNEQIKDYMNATKEILYFNSIDENTLQRNNGMDMDSDAALCTTNKILVDLVEKNYNNYLVPTSLVEADKTHYVYSDECKADLDAKTKNDYIGKIINLSQKLNSKLWNELYKNPDYSYLELYSDICILAVLSGMAIDSAKKEYNVKLFPNMLKSMEDKHFEKKTIGTKTVVRKGKEVEVDIKIREYPKFAKSMSENNGYTKSKSVNYIKFDAPMDYLQTIMYKAWYKFFDNAEAKIAFSDLLTCMDDFNHNDNYRETIGRVLTAVGDANMEIGNIWNDETLTIEEKRQRVLAIREELQEACQRKYNKATLIGLLKKIDDKKITKRGIGLYFQTILNIDLSGFEELRDENIYSLFDLITTEKMPHISDSRLAEIHSIYNI